jgi:predicted phosphodiesterase
MDIQLISDIHLEFYKGSEVKQVLNRLLVSAEVLILAGDIHVGRSNVADVLKFVSTRYEVVIFVPGNHEYYAGAEIGSFKSMNVPNNVFVLDNADMLYKDIHFIGSTLWSSLGREVPNMYHRTRATVAHWPDFKRIKENTLDSHMARYDECKDFIYKRINDLELASFKKKFVITHFMPSIKCVNTKWLMDPHSRAANFYFASDTVDVERIPENADVVWAFGHTHDAFIGNVDGIPMYCNPVGYPSELISTPYSPLVIHV